jgi:hypothetical protein
MLVGVAVTLGLAPQEAESVPQSWRPALRELARRLALGGLSLRALTAVIPAAEALRLAPAESLAGELRRLRDAGDRGVWYSQVRAEHVRRLEARAGEREARKGNAVDIAEPAAPRRPPSAALAWRHRYRRRRPLENLDRLPTMGRVATIAWARPEDIRRPKQRRDRPAKRAKTNPSAADDRRA